MCEKDRGYENVSCKRGFVTIATGQHRYYEMAVNLLHSYRVNGNSTLPFALICDKDCAESREFDHRVIIENPHNSFLDKLSLYQHTPYEETIFIDADSLILASVQEILEDFESMDDFCCYGKVLPIDSRKGWFFYEGLGDLKAKVSFNLNMHGGIYCLRKTAVSREVFENALNFAQNYHSYAFAQFDKPADEPVLALSMALSNCKPCDRKGRILFFPSEDGRLHVSAKGKLRFKRKVCSVPVLHFANINTKRYMYRYLSLCVSKAYEGGNAIPSVRERWCLRFQCVMPGAKALIRRVLKRVLPEKLRAPFKKRFSKHFS